MKLAPWLERIAASPLAAGVSPSSSRQLLLKLEEERQRDWRKLRRKLERLTIRLARHLSRQEEVAAARLADLAMLLAAWATAQRMAGLPNFAIDGLALAFPLAERSLDVWADAYCLQKTAYLGHFLGHDELALALINQAAVGLSEVGSEEDLARLAIDRGFFYFKVGRLLKAQGLLEAGLRRLQPALRQYRAAAHFALAKIWRRQKAFERAREELQKAVEIHDPATVEAGHIAWEAARIVSEGGALADAEVFLRKALSIFARLDRPGEIALVSLDYAEILFKSKRKAELKQLLGEVLGWLTPLGQANRELVKPFQNLWSLIVLDSLKLREIGLVRERVKKAAARLKDEP